jgi:hypothetical protein
VLYYNTPEPEYSDDVSKLRETSKRRNEQNQFNVKHKSLLATETVRAAVTVTMYKSVRLSRCVHMNTMQYRGSVEKSYTYDSHTIFIAALTRN